MKLFVSALLVSNAFAFSPAKTVRQTTSLDMVSRRESIVSGAAALLAGAAPAVASQAGIGADRDFAKDNEFISAQRATDGRLDLNAAPVGDYMQFPGMYPSAAGKIASNGPYDSVCIINSLLW
jgi:photosystem II PsbU protein